MASYSTPRIKTFLAEGDLSAKQYFFVGIGSNEKQIAVCSGSGAKSIGILMNKPSAAGQAAEVAIVGGGALLKLAGSVTAMKYLCTDANGKGLVASSAGDHVGAFAMDDGVSGDLMAVEVVCMEAQGSDV